MIWKAERLWADETAVILAGGPSLRGFDATVLYKPGWRVLAINDSWRIAPRCACLYFSDPAWFIDQLRRLPWDLTVTVNFSDVLYKRMLVNGSFRDEFGDHPQVRQLKFTGQTGLEKDPAGLRHGSNSTYAAMNLAYHLGVKRIVLLGLDMRLVNGRSHWHDEPRPDGFAGVLKDSMLPMFQHLVEPLNDAGVEVINATPDSALTCWPYQPLNTLLEGAYAHGD